MEKLIIKTRKSSATNKDWEEFEESLTTCGCSFEKMDALFDKYKEKFYSDLFEVEYPDTLFENMTKQEEVLKFFSSEIEKNNYVDWEVVEFPESFKKLEVWTPWYAENNENYIAKAKENLFYYYNNWQAANRDIPKETWELADKVVASGVFND